MAAWTERLICTLMMKWTWGPRSGAGRLRMFVPTREVSGGTGGSCRDSDRTTKVLGL